MEDLGIWGLGFRVEDLGVQGLGLQVLLVKRALRSKNQMDKQMEH